MKTILKSMKNKKNGIPEKLIPEFENIVEKYKGDECEEKFMIAMEKLLTRDQRILLYEQNGSCKGTASDNERKAFAKKNAKKSLAERLDLFAKTYGRDAVLSKNNTIIVTFKCSHGYYKHAQKGKFKPKGSLQSYFERCAGGRLYEYEIALGVKLKIKSVDISPLKKDITNPVVYTFEIVE